MKVIKSANQIF